MGSSFFTFLQLGFAHISDLNGYDHILFIAALCAVYQYYQWRELLWLVTAFTVGHSITLVLATFALIPVNADLIEFLIPVTIFITSLINIADKGNRRMRRRGRAQYYKYALALGFGLIHGMGFSSYLRALLGMEESIALPLFAFNVGLEVGQIAVVMGLLVLSWLMVQAVRMAQREWNLVLSGATAGIALMMMIERSIF